MHAVRATSEPAAWLPTQLLLTRTIPAYATDLDVGLTIGIFRLAIGLLHHRCGRDVLSEFRSLFLQHLCGHGLINSRQLRRIRVEVRIQLLKILRLGRDHAEQCEQRERYTHLARNHGRLKCDGTTYGLAELCEGQILASVCGDRRQVEPDSTGP
jgi:hypothetical protein